VTVAGGKSLLALNLGSATLKAARFDGEGFAQAAGRVEIALQEHPASADALLADVAQRLGFESAPSEVGHRIVHGGDAAAARVLDAPEVVRLQDLARLAPLHQPAALAVVASATQRWPRAVQRGVYDTAWHSGLPENARRLPVPQAWEALGIRRYGFHGLAFASALRALAATCPNGGRGRVVLAHLGGGASLCAVSNGRSVDTTMAMTPLEGLPMATRSGSLDPGALLFLLRSGRYTVDSLDQALYRECGLRGLSGLSGDMRELLASDAPAARLAVDVFALRVAQGIAAMATHLGGIDDLVFSGGIGSHAAPVRARIAAYLAWLGVALDDAANAHDAELLSPAAARVRAWRFVVDEEREIATACAAASFAGGAA
jgi:acetate kinase